MGYSAPTTRTTGDLITAAIWNQDVVDNENAAFPLGVGAWTSYTPTLTQNATLTKTVNYAKYQRIGRTIFVQVKLSITSAGTAGNTIKVGLPVTAADSDALIGSFTYLDSGTQFYAGSTTGTTTTAVELMVNGATASSLGVTPAVTAASGDIVRLALTYEAAT